MDEKQHNKTSGLAHRLLVTRSNKQSELKLGTVFVCIAQQRWINGCDSTETIRSPHGNLF
jgi:hypothetical protein